MNHATRDAILRGVASAAETHDAFRLRDKHDDGLRAIDVFALIAELQIPLEFRPLDALLGACVRVNDAEVGILVTTQRDLHMQRFTAAHELGHFILEHEGSLDREVRMPGHTEGRDHREVEADAFAAEFLMPKWLVRFAAERRGWWSEDALRKPEVVYQLSLRLAASYEATCWTLVAHDYIPRSTAEGLLGNGKVLKEVKRSALRGVPLDDPWADVWLLQEGDDGADLDAGPNDVFIVDLEEKASSGFRWDPLEAQESGFVIVDDSSAIQHAAIGGSSRRRLALRSSAAGHHHLTLTHARSFAPASGSKQFHLSLSTIGTRRDDDAPLGFERGQYVALMMIDSRSLLPPVRDQGERETCLTMALTDGHHAARREPPILAPEFLHFHAAVTAGVDVNAAVPISAAIVALESEGQPAEVECPYSPVARPSSWNPPVPTGDVWRRKTLLAPGGVWKAIQDGIGGGNPVVVVLNIDDAFWSPLDGTVAVPRDPVRASHALLALELEAQASPRVLVRNSWGRAWGDDGYAWLSSEYLKARCTAVITFGEAVA